VDLTLVKRPTAKPLTAEEWIYGFVSAVTASFLAGALYGWARNLFSAWK